MSISDYYDAAIRQIEAQINLNSEDYLLGVNSEELTEYHCQQYQLPLIEKDETRKIDLKKGKSSYGRVPILVHYPIVPKTNLHIVISHRSSTYFRPEFPLTLQEGWLITQTEMHDEHSLKVTIESIEKAIGWRNTDVSAGNERIRNEIRTYIEERQKAIRQEYEKLNSIIEKVEIALSVRREEPLPVVNFGVKEELKPLIKPEPKKPREFILDCAKVTTLIEYISNSCLSFEKTPKVFSGLGEEYLRDVIIGNLNAIFKGEATGETFSKLGKTDVFLRISEGNILIIECKYWDGKAKYTGGIDQLFRYLTWRENFGILVTFVKRSSFTRVVQEAKEATQEHATCISGSLRNGNASEFVTEHKFPEDREKRVEIHHLLFNLFVE